MNCTLILVGTELLNGGTLDTNSIFIAEELNKYGISIDYKITAGDSMESIIKALSFAKSSSQLVIVSGGMGPTDDDLTKAALAKFLNKKLIVDEIEAEELRGKFKKLGINFLEKNFKEVEKPEGAVSISNNAGMAPGIFIDEIAVFPGVPRELYDILPRFLEYYAKEKKLNLDPMYIRDIIVLGIPESILEEKVKSYFTEPGIEYEFLVKNYGIVIRLQGKESSKNIVEKIIEKIYNRIGSNIYGEDNERLETKIIDCLKSKGYSIAVAESCSGGLLSSTLVDVPGVSQVFKEGVISYSNEAKESRLKVKKELIDKYGAVSREVAEEMVRGLDSDVAVSITGIAGPEGGSEAKPVGLVYIGIRVKNKVVTYKELFKGDRRRVRERAVLHSLFKLLKILEEDESK